MIFKWNKEYLDLILVPGGLFVMFGYHLVLLHRYLRYPETTVLGFENHCKKAWVNKIMQIDSINRGPAFSVISSTISAATYLASTSLALGSFIVAWIGNSSNDQFVAKIIYGDTRTSVTPIKYISMLFCFLLAFASFIQSAGSYVHVNFLLSMPNTEVPERYVMEALVQGANFWQLGLRAIYFAITLMFWIFGPIPMFLSSVATVVVLHVLDVNEKPFSMIFALFPCFILLIVSCIIPIPSEGLKIALIPPHSPESPAYLGNLTISKKIEKLVKRSRSRAEAVGSNLFPTKNTTLTSPHGESKLLRPPIDGTVLGGATGFVYAAKIGIGHFNTDPKYKTYKLALDTGSELIWLQCEGCLDAGNTCYPQAEPPFPNSLSETFWPLNENDLMCISAPRNPDPNKLCNYNIEYADGARTKGRMGVEIFSFESETPAIFQIDVAFGCGYDQTNFFVKPGEVEDAAGIMGLARSKLALQVQLDDNDHVGYNFSYCFQDLFNLDGGPQRPSYLRFIDDIQDDPSTFQVAPFQADQRSRIYYSIRLLGIRVDENMNVPMAGPLDGLIIDSGAGISHLIRPVYESMVSTLFDWLNRKGRRILTRQLLPDDDDDGPALTTCFEKLPSEGYETLPAIHLLLEGGGDFEIQPEQGFIDLPDDHGAEQFCLMIEPNEDLSIIGAYQQVNHRLVFDAQHNQLMFKNQDCANNP